MRLAVLTLLLGALLAACGGSTAAVQEAPGPPVALDEPGNAAALAPNATATPTATAGATPTASATSSTGATGSGTGTGTGTGTTGTSPSGTTGTAPSGTQTGSTGTSTQPPPPGSDAQKFEQFCAQNPGAC